MEFVDINFFLIVSQIVDIFYEIASTNVVRSFAFVANLGTFFAKLVGKRFVRNKRLNFILVRFFIQVMILKVLIPATFKSRITYIGAGCRCRRYKVFACLEFESAVITTTSNNGHCSVQIFRIPFNLSL